MNCHYARQLISPYLDQQLTGRQMLALQEHFGQCSACEGEMRSIRQVKLLLRGLHDPRPRRDISEAIALRLAASEGGRSGWNILDIPVLPTASVPPQRGRRLAAAFVLSSVTILLFAAPFAPASRDGAQTASGFVPSSFSVTSEPLPDPLSLSARPSLASMSGIDPVTPRMILADDMNYAAMTAPDSPSSVVNTLPRDTFPGLITVDPSERAHFDTLSSLPVKPEVQSRARVSFARQFLFLPR